MRTFECSYLDINVSVSSNFTPNLSVSTVAFINLFSAHKTWEGKKSYFTMYNCALLVGNYYLGTKVYIFYKKEERDKNVNVSTLILWYWSRM